VEEKFALMEAVVPPGLGAPLNSHAGESEAFKILEGEFDFFVDGQKVPARAGDTVVIPDGAAHAFTCTGALLQNSRCEGFTSRIHAVRRAA
jgi:mannose-6-phosphate isomerase-like protein (cupin superfamily)